jgi:hypothetical protein
LQVYDQTLRVLKDAMGRAKLGLDDRLTALRRLDEQAWTLERGADSMATQSPVLSSQEFDQRVAAERAAGSVLGGRTVKSVIRKPRQLALPL